MDPALGTLAGQSLAWSVVQAWGRSRRSALGPQEGLQDPAAYHTQSVGVDPEALLRVVLSSCSEGWEVGGC